MPPLMSTEQTLMSRPLTAAYYQLIDWDNPSLRDLPLIRTLDAQVRSLGLDKARAFWPMWLQQLETALVKIVPEIQARRELVAAMILAGAAVSRDYPELRGDLAPSLYDAVKAFHAAHKPEVPKLEDGFNPAPMQPLAQTGPGHFVAAVYQQLWQRTRISPLLVQPMKGHQQKESKLDAAIAEILTGKSKAIRLGQFSKLDVNRILTERNRIFGKPPHARYQGPPRPGDGQKYRESTAPTSVELRLKNFHCLQQNEHSDDIFWTGWFYRLRNLEEVYKQIDSAIQLERTDELVLCLDWEITKWKSDLRKGITLENPNRDLHNVQVGSSTIHHGFGPWLFQGMCIEDDDAEYDAVTEVFETIEQVADVVGEVADVVVAVSGPTVIGAGAAAISTAANLVECTAAVCGAVVDIANFFDDDDMIGYADIAGQTDYIGAKANAHWPQTPEVGNTSIGRYRLDAQEQCGSKIEKFHRTWRIQTQRVYGKRTHHGPNPFGAGGSGEDKHTLRFPGSVDAVSNWGVHDNREKGKRHAEWVSPPTLRADQKSVRGTVHYGYSEFREINYTPWVDAWEFLTNL